MNYSEIFSKVSKELCLPKDIVANTYKAYWLFIRNTIERLPLKEALTDEEFSTLKCNINIPSLGKLVVTKDKYKKVKERFNYIKYIIKNDDKDK